jgi:hypothetical protein
MGELPRWIDDLDEFEGLPVGAVVVDNTNHAWVKGQTQWWSTHPYDAEHHNNPMKMKRLALVYVPGCLG